MMAANETADAPLVAHGDQLRQIHQSLSGLEGNLTSREELHKCGLTLYWEGRQQFIQT